MTEYNGLYTPSKGWCGYTHIGDMVYIYNSIDSTMDIKKYELEYYYPNQVIKSEDRAYFEFIMPNKRNTLKTFSNVKVHLPDSFQNEEDINVFVSKNERVSGLIYCKIANVKTKKNENEITFSYTGGSYNCMMKILMPSYLFGDIEEVSYIYTLPELVSYENSRKSLQEVIWDEFIKRTIPVVIVGISIYIIVIKIFFGKKGKLYNSLKNSKKRKKYKYYRNVDIGNMTPLEAWVLTNNEFRHIPSKDLKI